METLWQDLRYATRQLRKSPVFAITAILTLALGVGANTAIFSLLDQALLRSLPVRDPQSLVVLEGTGKAWQGHSSSHGGDPEAYFSYPMYRDLRDRNQAFEGLIATAPADIDLTRAGSSQVGSAELVSGNYFTLLGVQPALGRLFTQSEDQQQDANPVAVLAFSYWKSRFGADPKVVGETVLINNHPFVILGVSAPRFRSAVWGETPGVFVPMAMIGTILPGDAKRLADHTDKWMNIIGRLKPGVTRSEAEVETAPLWHALRADELKALGHRSQRFTADFLTNSRLLAVPGARGFSYNRDSYEKPLLAVMAMAILVLLMAGVNVASLLLVRSASRLRDYSLRYAMGADARRIVQQLLIEGLLLGVAGGAAGMLLASSAIRGLVHQLGADDGSGVFTSSIDLRLLLFNFVIAVAVSVLFSLVPAVQLRRPNLSRMLGQQASTGSSSALSFRRVVVCLQIGLSVVLLAGAGLFVRSMQKLRAVDVGFNTSHLVSFGVHPLLAGYAPGELPALQQSVADRLGALPGVQAVGATSSPELAHSGHGGNVTVAGYTAPPDEDFDVEKFAINPQFFAAMQVPLLSGRYFTDSDTAESPGVAIVNESFVRHFCKSDADCLGRMMGDGQGNKVKIDTQIVGIVRDTKHEGVRDPGKPTMFQPLKRALQGTRPPEQIYFYARTYADPAQSLTLVRRTMQQLDSKLALDSLRTMDDQLANDLSNDRLVMLLALAFGVLAAALAGVGLYGVLAYSTAQRTREIGIRMALGSSRIAVAKIILRDVIVLVGIGIAAALPAALGLSYLLRSQLFGVSPADPLSLATAVLLIAMVALLAALIPARRAAYVDPMRALRTE